MQPELQIRCEGRLCVRKLVALRKGLEVLKCAVKLLVKGSIAIPAHAT